MTIPTTAPFGPRNACKNLNHRRSDAPVGHCPDCGGLVNGSFHRVGCSDVDHDLARRQRSAYCVNCGVQLVGRYR